MSNDQKQFIADIYPGAKKISDDTGSSLEVVLAQTALETGWGEKVLPGTNNLYNIKADASWKGKTAEFTVPEVDPATGKHYMSKEKFRVYETYADSMADRAKFLAENHRYEKAGLYDEGVKGNLEKEAAAIAKAGYATDPDYAEKIVATARGRTMRAGLDLAEGKAHEPPGSMLRQGAHGDSVKELQGSLAALGYTDSKGRPLKPDGDFGPGTDYAVKAFQRDNGLREDGVAGKETLASVEQAVRTKEVPSMMDVGHPAKGMYDQAFRCVSQIDKDHQRDTGPHSQMLSGSLVSAATAAGFSRIDHVVLSDDAVRAYAVQGDLKSPFKQYTDVNVMQAIQTPLTQSSAEAVNNIQANEQARTQQNQQAMQQSQESQQQGPALHR